MGKKNKTESALESDDVVEDLGDDEAKAEVDVAALVARYAAAKHQLVEVEQDYLIAQQFAKEELSKSIEAIYYALGSGPFEILGELVTITTRGFPSESDPNGVRTVWFVKRIRGTVKKLG